MSAVITLSRQLGARGAEIACGVAAELNFRVVGREMVYEAIEGCMIEHVPLDAEEDKSTIIQRALDFIQGRPAVPDVLPVFNQSEPGLLSAGFFDTNGYYRSVLESIVFDLSRKGNVLIIGQAGQVLLRDHPSAFHTRVVAPMDKRIETIRQRFGLSAEKALHQIETSDRARAEYLKRHYKADIDDARLYDLTINTGKISPQQAIEVILETLAESGLLSNEEPMACSIEGCG